MRRGEARHLAGLRGDDDAAGGVLGDPFERGRDVLRAERRQLQADRAEVERRRPLAEAGRRRRVSRLVGDQDADRLRARLGGGGEVRQAVQQPVVRREDRDQAFEAAPVEAVGAGVRGDHHRADPVGDGGDGGGDRRGERPEPEADAIVRGEALGLSTAVQRLALVIAEDQANGAATGANLDAAGLRYGFGPDIVAGPHQGTLAGVPPAQAQDDPNWQFGASLSGRDRRRGGGRRRDGQRAPRQARRRRRHERGGEEPAPAQPGRSPRVRDFRQPGPGIVAPGQHAAEPLTWTAVDIADGCYHDPAMPAPYHEPA